MNTNVVNVAIVDGKTITQATELRANPQGQPVRIKAVANGKYVLAEGDKGLAPENITVKRVGKDLHVALEGTDPDQPQLIIEGFFDAQGQLVGVAEDGAYHAYIASDAEQDHEAAFLMDGVSSPQVLGSEELGGFDGLTAATATGMGWFWPALLGLGALAVGGAAWASNRDGGDDDYHDPMMPPTPQLGEVEDNTGDVQGPIKNGGSTDDTTPTFSGTGTPGNTIIVKDGDKVIGEVVVGSDGKWEFTPETPLAEGEHTIVTVEKDPAGNESLPSPGFELIVDTVAPGQPEIKEVLDDVGAIQGAIAQNGVTDDNTPTLNGTAEPGSTVEVFANGEKIGSTLVDADSNWSFTPDTALADGEYSFTTVAVDPAGNRGMPSLPYDLIIDTRGELIKIDHVMDDQGSIIGELQNGGVTDDTTPTLSGQATPGTQVNIYDKGVLIGTAPVDASGQWTFTPDTPLGEGQHGFTTTVVTPAHGESEPTPVFDLEIDTTGPGKPGDNGNGGIDLVADNVGLIQGPVADGGYTDDSTPTLSGGGQEPGDTVTIKDNGTIIGTAPVDKDGNWAFTPNPPLNDGEHKFTLIVTDPAGNPSEESAPYTIVVDTTAPAAKAIVESIGKDSGTLGDFLTNDGSAGRLISGSLTAALATGEKVQVSLDGGITWLDAILNGPDSWSFVDVSSHTSDWEIRTRVVDAAGNVNASGQDVTLDTTAPDAPTSIIVRTDSVDVEFDGSNLSVGDSISLAIGEQRFDYTLTQADIDAGKAAITVPTELQPLSEYGVSAAVVDAAGNNSQYISISVGATTEDFTSVTDSKVYTEGQTLSLSTMDVKVLQGQTFVGIYSNTPGYGEGKRLYFGYSAWDMLEITPKTPCTAMSFTTDYVHNVASYTFYDTNGNMLISLNYPGKPEGYEVSYTAPPGVLIGKVVAWTDEWGFLDNFKFERPDGFEWHDTPSEQIVGGEEFGAHYGSSGDDTFSLADAAGFASGAAGEIHGGAGIDTLKLTGQDQILDLTKLAEKVSSVEIVDLTGIGNNTLNLSLGDILEQGGTSLFIDDDHMQMMVKGNAGDVVNLDGLMADGSDPGNWATQGQVTVGGVVYEVYRHDALDAELLVQQGVQTNLV